MTSKGLCRLCGKKGKLIKAHILPRGFYSPIWDYGDPESSKSERVPIVIHLGEPRSKPTRTQSGLWDMQILCATCDGDVFGPLDKYATDILIKNPSWISCAHDDYGEPILQIVESYDYKKLKLFYMSVLWRSAVTSHPFFNEVKLEPWEQPLRDALIAGEPGPQDFFSVYPFNYTGLFSQFMQNPTPQIIEGVHHVRFRYPGGGFVIKIDQRSGPPQLQELALHPERELRLITKEFTDSQEHKVLLSQLTGE